MTVKMSFNILLKYFHLVSVDKFLHGLQLFHSVVSLEKKPCLGQGKFLKFFKFFSVSIFQAELLK